NSSAFTFMPDRGSFRIELHHEAVTPAVFLLRQRAHRTRQLGLGLRVDHPRLGRERAAPDARGHARLLPEILHPLRPLAMLGDQIVAVAALGEPDLDLARPARASSRRRQVEVLRSPGPGRPGHQPCAITPRSVSTARSMSGKSMLGCSRPVAATIAGSSGKWTKPTRGGSGMSRTVWSVQ